MKKLIAPIAGIAFLAGAILSGCETSAEKVENARENLQNAREDVLTSKIELDQALQDSVQISKTEFKQIISDYEKSIADLKHKANKLKDANKVAYEKALSELERKNNQLKKSLEEYKAEGADQWTSFKNEFMHDMNELGMAINDLTKNNVN